MTRKDRYELPRRSFLKAGIFGSLASIASVFTGRRALADDETDCKVTGRDILGPYYRPNAPFQSDIRSGKEGEVLLVTGKVESLPDCHAIEGAVIEVWQADSAGHYDNEDPKNTPKDYTLRGSVRSDAAGRYELLTIMPGRYQIGEGVFRPAHIHYKVTADGHAPLITQLYFEGDPHLAADPWARPDRAVKVETVEDEGEAKRVGAAGPLRRCVFDIVLKPVDKGSYGDWE